VIIAAEAETKSLLQREFQHITIIPVKGYRIRYSKSGYWLPFKLIAQVPNILFSIYAEHRWVKKVIKKYSINAILADNRFGLYHSGIPSLYITHQLLIKTGSNFTEKIVRKIHYWFIKKYSFCWVPDFEGRDNISGELAHPLKPPANVGYIGCLSRFEKKEKVEKEYDLLLLVSGPEPQRTLFEKLLLAQVQGYSGRVLLVRGLPGVDENDEKKFGKNTQNGKLIIRNHLSATELNIAIQQSDLLICRSGYTTIMDLVKLGQKAILVPTPGQTEQEYLAGYLMKQHFFYTCPQEGFSLTNVLKAVAEFPFKIPHLDMDQYKNAVKQFVQSL